MPRETPFVVRPTTARPHRGSRTAASGCRCQQSGVPDRGSVIPLQTVTTDPAGDRLGRGDVFCEVKFFVGAENVCAADVFDSTSLLTR
jgi:hypothetical protein